MDQNFKDYKGINNKIKNKHYLNQVKKIKEPLNKSTIFFSLFLLNSLLKSIIYSFIPFKIFFSPCLFYYIFSIFFVEKNIKVIQRNNHIK